MSATPRTDARYFGGYVTAYHMAGLCKELETELAESKAKLAQVHKDYGCELLDPNGTIWEHAAKVQKENADLKAALSAWENEALQSRASMELMEKGLDERDEMKRQIREGELMTVQKVRNQLMKVKFPCLTYKDVQEWIDDLLVECAASRQKEGVTE